MTAPAHSLHTASNGQSSASAVLDPSSSPRRGVFEGQSGLFARYAARLVMRDKLLGGVPKDPQLIEGWLRARAGLDDGDEIRRAMLRTLAELGVDEQAEPRFEQLEAASAALAARKQTMGFKTGEHGLYVEARQIKAMRLPAVRELAARLGVAPNTIARA